jgi:D-alanyl-lipoteichoic acid acyltransferase DltB (MBOAT superfamily)
MLFNAPIFLFVFLPIIVAIYYLLNSISKNVIVGKVWLILGSLFFYGYFNPSYLVLILGSLVFNFIIGQYLGKKIGNKPVLYFGVISNLILLGYYKYFDFFLENFNSLTGSDFLLQRLVLPLAISFFTFQQISFLVDAYKGKCREQDFLDYSLFVTFFPQLIAGPIVHHSEMMPQFAEPKNHRFNLNNFIHGIIIFIIGLIKKVVIADALAQYADPVFNAADAGAHLSFIEGWLGSLAYTFQIYFDFSGYCDMAIGVSLLFNIVLPINFKSPYKSANIQIFWRNWHMTLSRWMRDYIYIPLGGGRCSEKRVLLNVFATAFISGIWHGAGWNFVLWGTVHGGALIGQRLWSRLNKPLPNWLGIFVTFMFVHLAWVFFRALSFKGAFEIVRSMFDFSDLSWPMFIEYYQTASDLFVAPKYFESIQGLYWILIAIIISFAGVWSMDLAEKCLKYKKNPYFLGSLLFLFLFIGFISMGSKYSAFIYFNF